MPTILKRLNPVAKKEHKCMFCGCAIHPGETYSRDTLKYDGTIYDWVSHLDCMAATSELEMYELADDNGISAEDFKTAVDEYLWSEYQDESIDDIPEHIRNMNLHDKVRMILDDRMTKKRMI